MTSTRLASSGFEGFGWGAQSHGLIKPGRYPTGNRHPTKYLTLSRVVSVEFHRDTTKRGIKAKTYLFWSKKVKLFFFFFFSLFPAHFLAVIVKGTFQRFYTVPRATSTKCRPICQKSYRRTLFLARNCMISYVFEKIKRLRFTFTPICTT